MSTAGDNDVSTGPSRPVEEEGGGSVTKSNLLLLGISYPSVENQMKIHGYDEDVLSIKEESVDQAVECVRRGILTEMDARDYARCVATSQICNSDVYTCSMEIGGQYKQDRHLHGNFNSRNFVKNLRKHIGPDLKFKQIVLDYYWMPTGWLVTRWAKTLFQNTLPDLVRYNMLEFPTTDSSSSSTTSNTTGAGTDDTDNNDATSTTTSGSNKENDTGNSNKDNGDGKSSTESSNGDGTEISPDCTTSDISANASAKSSSASANAVIEAIRSTDSNMVGPFVDPNDASIPLDVGVVYLPFCAHCCKEIVGAIHILQKYYAIDFITKYQLPKHCLWKGTMQIDGHVMQTRLGKRLDQEEVYCTFKPKDIYESMEDSHISKPEVMKLLLRIPNYDDVRMIRLRPLKQYAPSYVKSSEEPPEIGGFKGLLKTIPKNVTTTGRIKKEPPPPPPKPIKVKLTAAEKRKLKRRKSLAQKKKEFKIRKRGRRKGSKTVDCTPDEIDSFGPPGCKVIGLEEVPVDAWQKRKREIRNLRKQFWGINHKKKEDDVPPVTLFYPQPALDLETYQDTEGVVAEEKEEEQEQLRKNTWEKQQEQIVKQLQKLQEQGKKLTSRQLSMMEEANINSNYTYYKLHGIKRKRQSFEEKVDDSLINGDKKKKKKKKNDDLEDSKYLRFNPRVPPSKYDTDGGEEVEHDEELLPHEEDTPSKRRILNPQLLHASKPTFMEGACALFELAQKHEDKRKEPESFARKGDLGRSEIVCYALPRSAVLERFYKFMEGSVGVAYWSPYLVKHKELEELRPRLTSRDLDVLMQTKLGFLQDEKKGLTEEWKVFLTSNSMEFEDGPVAFDLAHLINNDDGKGRPVVYRKVPYRTTKKSKKVAGSASSKSSDDSSTSSSSTASPVSELPSSSEDGRMSPSFLKEYNHVPSKCGYDDEQEIDTLVTKALEYAKERNGSESDAESCRSILESGTYDNKADDASILSSESDDEPVDTETEEKQLEEKRRLFSKLSVAIQNRWTMLDNIVRWLCKHRDDAFDPTKGDFKNADKQITSNCQSIAHRAKLIEHIIHTGSKSADIEEDEPGFSKLAGLAGTAVGVLKTQELGDEAFVKDLVDFKELNKERAEVVKDVLEWLRGGNTFAYENKREAQYAYVYSIAQLRQGHDAQSVGEKALEIEQKLHEFQESEGSDWFNKRVVEKELHLHELTLKLFAKRFGPERAKVLEDALIWLSESSADNDPLGEFRLASEVISDSSSKLLLDHAKEIEHVIYQERTAIGADWAKTTSLEELQKRIQTREEEASVPECTTTTERAHYCAEVSPDTCAEVSPDVSSASSFGTNVEDDSVGLVGCVSPASPPASEDDDESNSTNAVPVQKGFGWVKVRNLRCRKKGGNTTKTDAC